MLYRYQASISVKALKIVHTLLMTGSVTQTAATMNVSPGLISYELGKIRRLTGAPLFTRTKTGMQPDATAHDLNRQYCQYLSLQITEHQQHSAAPEKKKLSLQADTPVEMLLSGSLCTKTSSFPARLAFAVNNENPWQRLQQLQNGEVDTDIGFGLPFAPGVCKVKLLTSKAVIIRSRKQCHRGATLSLSDWYNHQHIHWAPSSAYYSQGLANSVETLRHLHNRKITITSASIINVALFCTTDDCISVIPDAYASVLNRDFPLSIVQLPSELDISYDICMHYLNQFTTDPAVIRTLSQLETLLRGCLTSP